MSTTNEIMELASEWAQETKDFGHLDESQSRDALLKAVEALAADAARFNWALPILSGDDDNIANHRALALGLKLMQGMSATDAIDAARKETP